MTPEVEIYDTTLRDGTQGHGISFSVAEVRIIDSTTGTAATTRVLIQSSDGVTEWGTIGVNENIVEASLQALVDSLECALIHSTSVS